ncbi:MAG: homoserine O-acetyltransferase MetX [Bdellovibrionota bacterium]|jgi:homoserine O-acetyltransferase
MRKVDSIGEVSTKFISLATLEREPLQLRRGGVLPEATLAYETYGELSAARDNAILVFHALSGSQHLCGTNKSVEGVEERWTEECKVGWWNDFVGPKRAIDTDKYFVICANYLGGCYGSTGPLSINPETGAPYGGSFPWITLADIVDSQVKLLDFLGIERLHGVVGASLGGMMALSLATRYPHRVKIVLPIATGMAVSVFQRILNFEQICAIEYDPDFRGGDYYGISEPRRGLSLARMISHKTFVSLETMQQRAKEQLNGGEDFGQYQLTHKIESYMLHQGSKFVDRFDANTYLCILGVWQGVDLLADAGCNTFKEMFARCQGHHFMVFSVDSDGCFAPSEQQALVKELHSAGVDVRHITIHSDKGHDSFLVEPQLFMPHILHSLEDDWWCD